MLAHGEMMQKRKPGQPHKGWKSAAAKAHDRQSRDLTLNAVVAPVVVEDPYERGGKIETTASLRDDILRHLRVRDEIDEAQFQAGRRYERLLEVMNVAPVRAMDTTKEPVDGGGWSGDVFTNKQFNAVRDMGSAEGKLGERKAKLVRLVLHERLKFKQIASSAAERDVWYVRRVFFECLEELAVFWNLAGKPK